MKKKILILCYSDLQRDPRIRRHVEALLPNYEIITCGYAPLTDKDIAFIPHTLPDDVFVIDFHTNYPSLLRKIISLIIKLLAINTFWVRTSLAKTLFKKYRTWRENNYRATLDLSHPYDLRYWTETEYGNRTRTLLALRHYDFDLVFANDLQTLPLALQTAQDHRCKVLYDAHEYTPQEGEDSPEWVAKYKDYYTFLCTKYLPKVAKMFTVCEGLAKEYAKNFNVKPLVLSNATTFYDLAPQEIGDTIRIIHHGIAGEARRLDLLVELMDYLPENFTLDLMLMNNAPTYIEKLKQMAAHNNRIRFIPTVPTQEIPLRTNNYDIGIFILPFTNLNYTYALPNKFFEFIQARLMIAIGASPEMQRITEEYDLGVVAPDFNPKSLATLLTGLDKEKIMYYKQQVHQAAYKLSAATNQSVLNEVVKEIFA